MKKYIGKKVIIDGTANGIKFKNEKGKIMGINGPLFAIEFQADNPVLHNCKGVCHSKRGYYILMNSDCIKQIEKLNYNSIW